jgi:L-ribulose-5-phosphate 4-epimerase
MFEALRQKAFHANLDIVKHRLVIITWGNRSAIDRVTRLVVNGSSCSCDMAQAEVEGEYEKGTGNLVVERFNELNPDFIPGVLVKNHVPFSWWKNAYDAVHNAVVMEQVAKMAYIAYGVNPNLTMNPHLIKKYFYRKHGPGAYYGQ